MHDKGYRIMTLLKQHISAICASALSLMGMIGVALQSLNTSQLFSWLS